MEIENKKFASDLIAGLRQSSSQQIDMAETKSDLFFTSRPGTPNPDVDPSSLGLNSAAIDNKSTDSINSAARRSPLEHTEEIMAILKTAHPLLILSMEATVEQMITKLKSNSDEDMLRNVVGLLSEGYQQVIAKMSGTSSEVEGGNVESVKHAMLATLERFRTSPHIITLKVNLSVLPRALKLTHPSSCQRAMKHSSP
jgi:hypothetical protein